MELSSNELLAPMAIKKIKILGAVLELPARQHCQSSPFTSKNGPNWRCCLAGSAKTAPTVLIISVVLGAEYSFYMKSIATYAPQFFGYNNSVLAIVRRALSLIEVCKKNQMHKELSHLYQEFKTSNSVLIPSYLD